MTIIPTKLPGCYLIEPKIIRDDRGYFMEAFNEKEFVANVGSGVHFVQQNQSQSKMGVLRGLHYQTGEHAQAKLIRVLSGSILDVAVDIRPESETYGQYFSVELSAENNRQLFIPRGFAHGFQVLSNDTTVFYNSDNFYNPAYEAGIIYDDPTIAVDWRAESSLPLISEKDKNLPTFEKSIKVW
ncbi:dTDP-4-dehydrorhamnose 3,5-epimerase [Flavobacterium caeni]|uniref:dTDP-4-dehydrorhamnose 3,5-epimerase n=1 Tax=Flavobacterium caeni TaxID=490189 RepID=A0A1G5JBC3_9FLAO|nr:dTDP-4-dehydrorhamnose 3,5-epimerase [Flavobacterium caeni]SCY85537.1 dTDP-4-dehydrorhamnose 3,5-epimerase [Flavobacterium caeni]